jgi:hypothetical protein
MAKMFGITYVQAKNASHKFSAGNPIGLVLHRTEASYAHCLKSFQHKGDNPHFLIGKNSGEVAQMVDTDIIAHHAKDDANQYYLGIEFESIAARKGYEHKQDPLVNADPLTDFQITMGIHIISWICRTHGIPPVGPPGKEAWEKCGGKWRGVLGHADLSQRIKGKKVFRTDHGDTMADFLALGILPPDIFR